jgi:hypothetical protein
MVSSVKINNNNYLQTNKQIIIKNAKLTECLVY